MRGILTAIIIICFCNAAAAQLTNTTWTGNVTAGGNNLNILWKLASDTSFFYNNDDNSLLDVSVFKVLDSTLILRKVSGLSSCGDEEGIYKFAVKDNSLNLYLTKDDCNDRHDALDKSIFTRKENK